MLPTQNSQEQQRPGPVSGNAGETTPEPEQTRGAFQSVEAIESARGDLPVISPSSPVTALQDRNLTSGVPSMNLEVSAAFGNGSPVRITIGRSALPLPVVEEIKPAPDIALFYQQPPFSENQEMQTPERVIYHLTQSKNSAIRAPWLLEYLRRYHEELHDPKTVLEVVNELGRAAAQGRLPLLSPNDAETFSLLIAKLCSQCENSVEYARSLENLCSLILYQQPYLCFPILSQDAISHLISSLLVVTPLKQLSVTSHRTIFEALEILARQNLLGDLTPEAIDIVTFLIISTSELDLDNAHLPLTSDLKMLPGIIDRILTQEELPPLQRFYLCKRWSHPALVLSAPARESLCRLLQGTISPTISDEQNAIPDQGLEEKLAKQCYCMIAALETFTTLVEDATLSPLAEQELQAIGKLIEQFVQLKPFPEDMDRVMGKMVRLIQMQPSEYVKFMEKRNFDLAGHCRH